MILDGARESVFETTADHSFFTEPVSCLVFNAVGSTNVSILVDVHCKFFLQNNIYTRENVFVPLPMRIIQHSLW